MKRDQKGVVRYAADQSEIVGMFEKAAGESPRGNAVVMLTREHDGAVLYMLSPGEILTVQWTEDQGETDHGERTRPN